MRITFRVRFHTHPGQSLWLTGEHDVLGAGDFARAIPLKYVDAEFWETTLVFPQNDAPPAVYNYVLRQSDGSVIYDWGSDRRIPANLGADEILIIDSWNPAGLFENVFFTEPFREVLLKPKTSHSERVRSEMAADHATHTFRCKAPLLGETETLCLLGDSPELAKWDTSRPVLLERVAGEDFLSVSVDLSRAVFPVAYKYGVYDLAQKSFVRWEDGANRTLFDTHSLRKYTLINDGFARLGAAKWRGAGVAVPVFSLRTEKSFGVGEFTDLKPLVDWCAEVGIKLIQILPVNDTIATKTWTDSYPYAAISAFALHPQYLNLDAIAGGLNKKLLASLEEERKRLNSLEAVDYEAVMSAKMGFLKQIFPSQKERVFKSKEFNAFFAQNESWLAPYAAFSVFRDEYGTADFTQWPAHRKYEASEANGEAAQFYHWLQFHLHQQLRDVARYAHQRGVVLKGDIPIGVYRYGADAWQSPELYNMDVQAGAPPDPFAEKGQNWGFPTYNWPRMKETGFAWWKQRFAQMGEYFDAFRIDHILGFFRIWSIPLNAVEGILGYFVPALPVRPSEFEGRGVPFDRERFVKPWITDELIGGAFGERAEYVRSTFLDIDKPSRGGSANRYALKPEFATQRQIETYFQVLEFSTENHALKLKLFDLISNVILLEVTGPGNSTDPLRTPEFHFRFGMQSTASFQALDPHTRAVMHDLYVDYFFRRQDGFWMREAMQKLPALKRVTRMLVCGEDLGLVPACVPDVMKQLGLLSLEIQRMPKDTGKAFSRPAEAPYLSVVTPGTHDMSTIRGWWMEDRALTQRFYNQELGLHGDAPVECEPWIVGQVLKQHLASPAMWCIIQLQDFIGMDGQLRRANTDDERINIPVNPKHYWRYRMHLPIERLQKEESFNAEVRRLVQESGR